MTCDAVGDVLLQFAASYSATEKQITFHVPISNGKRHLQHHKACMLHSERKKKLFCLCWGCVTDHTIQKKITNRKDKLR